MGVFHEKTCALGTLEKAFHFRGSNRFSAASVTEFNQVNLSNREPKIQCEQEKNSPMSRLFSCPPLLYLLLRWLVVFSTLSTAKEVFISQQQWIFRRSKEKKVRRKKLLDVNVQNRKKETFSV